LGPKVAAHRVKAAGALRFFAWALPWATWLALGGCGAHASDPERPAGDVAPPPAGARSPAAEPPPVAPPPVGASQVVAGKVVAGKVVAGKEDPCQPFADLRERHEGDLTVPVEPRPLAAGFLGRMRHHSDGSLTAGSARLWFGPPVPRFVPLHEGTSELHLLERDGEGWAAVYRDPYGAGSCDLSGPTNCRVVVTGYGPCGERRWSHDLTSVLSRSTHLEVQDVRAEGGLLYFNEACQGYAREAGGQCSSLVAFDPTAGRVLWRTKPLVSNNRLLVLGDYVVAGYGFTAEADHVSLVRRRDGVVVHRQPLAAAHEDLVVEGGDTLVVRVYPGDRFERFTLRGLDGDQARLVRAR
jgi:hypothetical protein